MTDGSSLPPGSPGPLDPQILKAALKAYKKRLKVTVLDKESGKMAGPLSGGKTANIVAITPPNQYSREVWDELVKQGKLRYEGHGMYQLIDGA